MLKHTLPDTPGKSNVIARAVQLTDIRWTPVGDVPTYTVAAGKTVHKAFVEVTGLPYSSTEPTDTSVEVLGPEGKRIAYDLLIPKDDDHQWENREVEFFGHRWRTVGFVLQWPRHLTPGLWDRKVRVERYG